MLLVPSFFGRFARVGSSLMLYVIVKYISLEEEKVVTNNNNNINIVVIT